MTQIQKPVRKIETKPRWGRRGEGIDVVASLTALYSQIIKFMVLEYIKWQRLQFVEIQGSVLENTFISQTVT